jgi:hypothetical protein
MWNEVEWGDMATMPVGVMGLLWIQGFRWLGEAG